MDPTNQTQAEEAAAADAVKPEPTNGKDSTIAELEAKVQEKEQRYLYLYAEFENFKKRVQKEREELTRFGWENVARDLVQVADNMERAVAFAPPTTDKNFLDGVKMVLNHFKDTLNKQGVKSIEGLNHPFDPNLHEAIGEEPSEKAAGTVVKEHLTGYTLHGRLLRPSRVVVSSGLAKAE